MEKMSHLILGFLVLVVFGFVLSILGMIPLIGWLIMYAVMFIVFMPLTFIWWSKLYLAIAKPKNLDLSKAF